MPDNQDDIDHKKSSERDIAAHVFNNSAIMIGLCLTVISLINGRKEPDKLGTIVDEIVAFDALLFLAACFLSYAALRSRHLGPMHRVETVADSIFLLGMIGMGVACVLFVWTIF